MFVLDEEDGRVVVDLARFEPVVDDDVLRGHVRCHAEETVDFISRICRKLKSVFREQRPEVYELFVATCRTLSTVLGPAFRRPYIR